MWSECAVNMSYDERNLYFFLIAISNDHWMELNYTSFSRLGWEREKGKCLCLGNMFSISDSLFMKIKCSYWGLMLIELCSLWTRSFCLKIMVESLMMLITMILKNIAGYYRILQVLYILFIIVSPIYWIIKCFYLGYS